MHAHVGGPAVLSTILRTLIIVLRGLWAPRREPLAEYVLRFRVSLGDLDTNIHMNNGRYLSLMDLGRVDMALRSGIYQTALRRRWMPVIGSAMVRFRRSLGPFQKFELRTRLVGWDDRWFFFEQRFESGDVLYALAQVRATFRSKGRALPPAEVLTAGGVSLSPPPLPPYLRLWAQADEEAAQNIRAS